MILTQRLGEVGRTREGTMGSIDVRIEKLAPMRVASVRAIGESPEPDAWGKLRAWAEPMGLLDDAGNHPVFGFNNPAPSRERKEYGYELWVQIGPDIEPEGEVQVKDFEGALYAVTTNKGIPNPEIWMKLWDWVQSSEYRWRKTHELEGVRNPLASEDELVFDLYVPIEE